MAETDAFIKKVTTQLRDMDKREQKLRHDADVIRAELVEMRQRRVELDRSLAVYREVMGVGAGAASIEVPEGTIADVALKILRDNGAPMSVGALVTELQALGKLKGGGESGRADYGTVYQAVNRDARFLKIGRGEFSPAPENPSAPPQPA